jgi:hypothetical protein
MEQNFIDERCDVFMNEREIRTKEKIEDEKFEEISSFHLENDDTMQLFMKKLHEQRLIWRPHGKRNSTWAFLC